MDITIYNYNKTIFSACNEDKQTKMFNIEKHFCNAAKKSANKTILVALKKVAAFILYFIISKTK